MKSEEEPEVELEGVLRISKYGIDHLSLLLYIRICLMKTKQ